MASSTASCSRHLLACLVLVGFTAPTPAADPPPTASLPTHTGDLARKLGDLRRDAFRHPPNPAGAEAVGSLYAHAFRQLGLFPASTETDAVSQDDFEHLHAVASRSVALRCEVLHALDCWMFLVEQSAGDDDRSRGTLTLLRGHAVRLEADEPNGPPLRQLRRAVAARDADALAAMVLREKAVSDDRLRHLPGCLYGQVHTVLLKSPNSTASLALRRLARLRPSDPVINVLLVKDSRNPVEASRYAYALHLSDPDNPAFRSLLGQTLLDVATGPRGEKRPAVRNFRDDDYDLAGVGEAVEHLEAAVRLNAAQKRPDPSAHYRLGVAREYAPDWHKGTAVVAFEAAVREATLPGQSADDAALYHLALAQALQHLGRDPNRVIREAEQCIKLCNARPQPPAVPVTPRLGVGELLLSFGTDEQALAHLAVGRAHLDLGRAAEAVPALTTAVRRRPKSAHAWFWLGKAHFAGGETRQAVEATKQAHQLAPTDPEVLSTLGEYALAEGDPKQAKEWFTRATEQAAKTSRLSAWQPGRLFSTDDGLTRAEELAAHQSVVSDPTGCEAAKPTVALGRAAAAGKRYSVAARTFHSLLSEPGFEDATGDTVRLAVGAAVRAGRDGLFGDCERQTNTETLHTLARKWADEELGRVRKELEQLAQGKGGLDRETLLDHLTQFQTDPLLAAVREPHLRAKLGAAERRSWESFWDAWNEMALSVRGLPALYPPRALGATRGGGLGGF